MAAGIQVEPLNHEEVLETGRQVEGQLAALLARVIPAIASDPKGAGAK
jgi:purine-nucleoside phosphorylase